MKHKKMKKRGEGTSHGGTTFDKTMKNIGICLLITVGICLALLLIGTLIAYTTGDPTAFVDPIGYVSLFLGSFFGGFVCSKLSKHSPYITSAACGALFVLISMLFSFALPHSLASGMKIFTRLALHALSLITFPIGALVGVKSAENAPRKKKKKRK